MEWQGAHNLRDLGGLRIRGGGRVAPGRLFRSDYPGIALERDPQGLQRLGLRTVVDLRRDTEADLEAPDWDGHGVRLVRCSLSAGRRSSWHASYERYLEHRPEAVVDAVRHVVDVDRHPVLFHCAAGKDRTGVVAALVLEVLGVEDDEIVSDHVASAASVTPVLARLRTHAVYDAMLASTTVAEQLPRAEDTRRLLAWLRERGGAAAWLEQHGVDRGALAAFRAQMTTPEAPLP
ncbi:MAG: protein tyrosine/serine phosphatase [Nocardioides sp.]|nr:protein tyrosine/serine phosphatase [Nocardioides sp.]